MSSREMRRHKKRNQEEQDKRPKDDKRKSNPILYIFSFIILVIIVVTFVGTPVAGRIGQTQKIIFGTYADKEIEFRPGNYLSRQKDILGEQVRQNSNSQDVMTQAYQVWREAFRRTVIHVGILHKAEKSNVSVTDEQVDVTLTQYGPYVQNGTFSQELYEQTPNTEKYIIRQLYRENIIEEQYRRDFFERQKISTESKHFLTSLSTPERMFTYVSYAFRDYPKDQVIEYGKNNIELFQRINLSRIAISTGENEAETILNQIEAGETGFETLAQTQSVDSYAEKGGDMGWVVYHELLRDFPNEESLKAVFSLNAGEVSDIIEHRDMWFIYRCDEPAANPDFTEEDTVQKVRTYLERYEAGRIEDYFVERANQFKTTAEETGFEEASNKHDKVTQYTDYFPINYGNAFFLKPVRSMGDSQALNSAPYNENFFIQAFSLKENEVSEPIILDRNVVVMQLQDEREASEEEVNQLKTYYNYIVQQYRDQDLRNYFLNSDKLEDNFNQVFSKYFMPQPKDE